MTENVTIRPMKAEDYDDALALWLSCRGMSLRSVEDSRAGIAAFLKRNPGTCFAAEADGKVVGTILAGNDGRRGYLYHVAVGEAFRNRGIGAELVHRAMRSLRRAGIRKTALVVLGSNLDGNEFWDRVGFTVREDLVYRNKEYVSQEETPCAPSWALPRRA